MGFTPIVDDTGKITGYKTTKGGADTVFPFSGGLDLTIDYNKKMIIGKPSGTNIKLTTGIWFCVYTHYYRDNEVAGVRTYALCSNSYGTIIDQTQYNTGSREHGYLTASLVKVSSAGDTYFQCNYVESGSSIKAICFKLPNNITGFKNKTYGRISQIELDSGLWAIAHSQYYTTCQNELFSCTNPDVSFLFLPCGATNGTGGAWSNSYITIVNVPVGNTCKFTPFEASYNGAIAYKLL